jgi:hypothetical protein
VSAMVDQRQGPPPPPPPTPGIGLPEVREREDESLFWQIMGLKFLWKRISRNITP